jgi:rubrerythrin
MEMITHPSLEDESELASALRHALHACQQSQQTYAQAANSAPSAEFTILFGSLASERAHAVRMLSETLLLLSHEQYLNGAEPGLDDLHQSATLDGTNDAWQADTLLSRQKLLEMCAWQEQRTLEHYERLLQMDLPATVAPLIRQQHAAVTAALLSIGTWKPF